MPNVLLNVLAGIDPPSSKRRRHFHMQIWVPIISFLLSIVLFLMTPMLKNEGDEALFFASLFSSLILLPFLVIVNLFRTYEARCLQHNWQDYRMAGISGADMLRAFTHSRLCGSLWTYAVGVGTIVLSLAIMSNPPGVDDKEFWLIFIPLMVECGFLLMGGIYLDVAMMTTRGLFFYRSLAFAAFFLTGVPAVGTALMMAELKTFDEAMLLAWGLGLISLSIRSFVVMRLWNRASERLESEDFLV